MFFFEFNYLKQNLKYLYLNNKNKQYERNNYWNGSFTKK